MKTSTRLTQDGEETFDLKGLTLLEVKWLHAGLLLMSQHNNSPRITAMAATISVELLKPREIPINSPVDTDTVLKRDAKLLKQINRAVPIQITELPILN